jgi:prepilin-type N-terminal cleavage/methylation domain-containing protein
VKNIPIRSSIKRHAINGFTLVELLIVVIILAILAAIVVPQFASTTDDAKAAAADSTLSNLRAAIDLYYQQHGAYPGALTSTSGACAGGGTTGTAALATKEALQYQLSLYSKANGETCSVGDTTNFKFGPYMKKATLPPDPFSNVAGVEISTAGNLNMTATAGNPGGWKYDVKTGKLIINLSAHETR